MKKAILLTWLAVVLGAAPAAQAGNLSYNYFRAGYDSSTFGDKTTSSGSTVELEGAYVLGAHRHVMVHLSSANYNNDTEVTEKTLALGVHGALSRKIHLLGRVSAESIDFYNGSIGWDDQTTGIGGQVLFRYLTGEGSEIQGGYKMMQLDGMNAAEYTVDTATYFNDNVAVTLGYTNRDGRFPFPSTEFYRFGLRMDL